MLNDSFSSPFKSFKQYQDHIFFVRVVHCWVLQISPTKRAQSFTFESHFQLSDLEILRVFVPLAFGLLKTIVFLDIILTGYLIPAVC